MLEEHSVSHLLPTYANLSADIERGHLPATRLDADYCVTSGDLHRWQLAWLRERLRRRYPGSRPDREAS